MNFANICLCVRSTFFNNNNYNFYIAPTLYSILFSALHWNYYPRHLTSNPFLRAARHFSALPLGYGVAPCDVHLSEQERLNSPVPQLRVYLEIARGSLYRAYNINFLVYVESPGHNRFNSPDINLHKSQSFGICTDFKICLGTVSHTLPTNLVHLSSNEDSWTQG